MSKKFRKIRDTESSQALVTAGVAVGLILDSFHESRVDDNYHLTVIFTVLNHASTTVKKGELPFHRLSPSAGVNATKGLNYCSVGSCYTFHHQVVCDDRTKVVAWLPRPTLARSDIDGTLHAG